VNLNAEHYIVTDIQTGFIDTVDKVLAILNKWINLETLLKKVKIFEIELLFATVPEYSSTNFRKLYRRRSLRPLPLC
jgi:hypothetical protein